MAGIAVLTKVKPDDARAILCEVAANGTDGRRHVAAGVPTNLGEEPPPYRQTTQRWLLIDLLTALRAAQYYPHRRPAPVSLAHAAGQSLVRVHPDARLDGHIAE
jgi:hypothetical protein